MKKLNVLHFLEETLAKELPEDAFAIDWNSKNHQIEILVRIFAENKESAGILDMDDVLSEEEVIEFEDAVLLYDEKHADFDNEDYLAAFSFNRKQGISKGEIRSIAVYVKEVLEEGTSDLLDFLNDEEQTVFALKWDDNKFKECQEKEYAKGDSQEFVAYPNF